MTRSKSDKCNERKDLEMMSTVDEERWGFVMGSDFLLQVDYYKNTALSQLEA